MRIDMFNVTKLFPTAGIWMAVVAACVFSTTAFAQSAQQILGSLDADGSGAISKDEAVDDMKTNFSFIDTNGDGGIDLGELETILKFVASQNGQGAPTAQAPSAQRSSGDPSYGKSNPDAGSFMNVSPEDDTMLYILNLQKYRENAEYDDGRETELTGQDADELYDPMPEIHKVGGGLVYHGVVKAQIAGKEPTWDAVSIVMYPSRRKVMEMSSSQDFKDTAQHKSASLGVSQIIITTPQEWTFSDKKPLAAKDIPYPATAQDQSFTFFHLVKYRDVAEYPPGSNEPKRSGREAMELFEKSVEGILHEAGVTPMLRAEVDGVVVGDGRKWSDYLMLRFPSHRAFEDVLQKIGSSDFGHHHAAAIEDEYTLELQNQFDLTANPPTPGNISQASPQQSIDTSQASFILSALDANKDGRISENEAVDDMKANFAMIDSNGDGGIDIDELTQILRMSLPDAEVEAGETDRWLLSLEMPDGSTQNHELMITQNDTEFSAVYHADGNAMDVEAFTAEPDGSFSFKLSVPDIGLSSVFSGTSDGQTASGVAKYEMGGESGEVPFTAKLADD
jgi:uncharacterized protein (DUF1330 family)